MGITNEEAIQLAKQGFTANEIRALGWTENGTSNENQPPESGSPDSIDTGAGSPNNPPAPDTSDDKKSEIDATIKSLSETVASLTETVKQMQISNQKTAKKSKNDGPKSADEVIKGFIENM